MKKNDLLLVIDMQNVYTTGQKWACRDTEGAAGRVKQIIASGKCSETIFTCYLPAAHPTGVWKDYNMVNEQVNNDVWANKMLPAFDEELKNYPLYAKSVYSSLAIPEVLAAARRADRVIITGVVAECCVLSTVFALIDEGIYTVYLTDAVSGLDLPKEQATELLLSGLAPLHLNLMTTKEYLSEDINRS